MMTIIGAIAELSQQDLLIKIGVLPEETKELLDLLIKMLMTGKIAE